MPDYIYLLENRLSAEQQHALRQLREATREAGMLLFLTGDAVRDLTSGHAVRELEVTVHGSALKLKKPLEKFGARVWGEDETSRTLYLCFPGTVRVDLVSAHRAEYPKPGKPVFHPASIQEDLRRRDFTVNAMAISLNEGSFGLLMDPLNGAADIETRTLRLVSNYGFLEEPSLLIRATRYRARLGWELDPKTETRYQNARDEGVIEYLGPLARSRELEQIGHEEEGLKVLQALEAEGWMKVLFPAWTSARADAERLEQLHDQAVALLVEGVHPDMSAAQMQLLTAKMAAKDLAALKKALLRPGFVEEWDSLDAIAASFQKALLAKENAIPSACFRLFHSFDPEAILWLGFTTRSAAVKERYQQFLKEWPEVRQRIPHALMQEMRITPELATYKEVVEKVFLELIDGRLATAEEQKAFLEPFSPPAPAVQEYKRTRVKRRAEAKVKEEEFAEDEESEEGLDEDEDLDDLGGDDEEMVLDLGLPKGGLAVEVDADAEDDEESDEESDDEVEPVMPVKRGAKAGKAEAEKPAGKAPVAAPVEKPKAAPAPVEKAKAAPPAAPKPKEKKVPVAKATEVKAAAPARTAPAPARKPAPAPVSPKKAAPVPAAKAKPAPAVKARAAVKPAPKAAPKPAPKPAPKKAVVKPVPKAAKASKPAARAAKPVAKKHEGKAAKKR